MIYVLDTNILSKAFSNKSPEARTRLMQADASVLYLPTIVIAEVIYGIYKSPNPDGKRDLWNRFLLPFPRLGFDEEAAEHHARIRWDLRRQKIGDRDLVIAAVALSRGATVVTNNRDEFDRVPGLAIEDWTQPG
jgi:tRNA(fMet)-specific endonuclease VapC